MKPLTPAIAVFAMLASASTHAQTGPSLDEIRALLVPYASSTDSVTLPDGRVVGFTCMGEGSPTVILVPGMGDFSGLAWGNVQPQMAMTTRVCAWDRPGWGLSDGAEGKHTVATNTDVLEAALATGAIPGPYLMVGHSFGSFESLLFADRHPDQVVGMVLVDPSVPDQAALMARAAPALAGEAERQAPIGPFRQCASDIRRGAARAIGPDPNNCFQYPPFFPPELSAVLATKVSNPLQYETMASFFENAAESTTVVVNRERNYRDMPLTVLTATTLAVPPPGTSAEAMEQAAVFLEVFGQAHDELAALSTRGINARVPGADHYIQRSRPEVVIDAVEAAVAEARTAMRLKQ